jgi:hypothetical protein
MGQAKSAAEIANDQMQQLATLQAQTSLAQAHSSLRTESAKAMAEMIKSLGKSISEAAR